MGSGGKDAHCRMEGVVLDRSRLPESDVGENRRANLTSLLQPHHALPVMVLSV